METIFDPLCSPVTEFVNNSPFSDDFGHDYVFTQYSSNNSDYTQSNDSEKFLNINFSDCEYEDKKDIGLLRDFDFLNPTDTHFETDNSIFQLSTLYDIPLTGSIFNSSLVENNSNKDGAFELEKSSDVYVNFDDSITSTDQIFDSSVKDINEKTSQLNKELKKDKNTSLNGNIFEDQKKDLFYTSNLTNASSFFESSLTYPLTPHLSPLKEHELKESLVSDSKLSPENSLKLDTELDDISKLFNNGHGGLSEADLLRYNTGMQHINDVFWKDYIPDESFLKKRSFHDFSNDNIYLSAMSLKNKDAFSIKNNIYNHSFNSMTQNNPATLLSQPYISPKSALMFNNNNLSFTNYDQITNENQESRNVPSFIPFEIYFPNTMASWPSKYNYPVSVASIKNKSPRNINLEDMNGLSPSKFKKTRKYPINSRSFINFTERDAEIILNGVAPSGNSKKH
ncbi:hypothetical protein PORY_002134 [Pneumocystis oryctolagi]|uniref:Uncharacterized protein n=1 Tax=Pneumocystis oryctolagi TaxID=42067 RepID=A0ACB7CC69_9ASCO|nr:hypothetical protein PORY_002134 [Pneumocystis oryctolagi]